MHEVGTHRDPPPNSLLNQSTAAPPEAVTRLPISNVMPAAFDCLLLLVGEYAKPSVVPVESDVALGRAAADGCLDSSVCAGALRPLGSSRCGLLSILMTCFAV